MLSFSYLAYMTAVCARVVISDNANAANMGIHQGSLATNAERSSQVGCINVPLCRG